MQQYIIVLRDYFTTVHCDAMRKLLRNLNGIEVDESASTDMELAITATTEDAVDILSALEMLECFDFKSNLK